MLLLFISHPHPCTKFRPLKVDQQFFEIQIKLSLHISAQWCKVMWEVYTAPLSCTQMREAVGVGTWKGCLPIAHQFLRQQCKVVS